MVWYGDSIEQSCVAVFCQLCRLPILPC